ncbi:MAG: transposase [Ignavibacteria bacterium]|nr:transposase [Ignavibacteria bacterium]
MRMGSSDYPTNRQRSVGAIVGSYKSATSRQIHELGLTTHPNIWQRGYHDRIIRDTRSLEAIRAYIRNNPIRARQRGR